MQPKDKISKASWNQFQAARDSVVNDVSNAVRDGKLKVEASSVQQLLNLIGASLEAGYHRSTNVFEREVESALAESASSQRPTKKKLAGCRPALESRFNKMSSGLKHLVRCRCVMPQFKNLPEPPQHQFVVFSVLDDNDNVQVKYAQCNNCGLVHKVIDVCKSEITSREALSSVLSVDDIRPSLPPSLVNILDSNGADLATWEAAQFIYENKRWGEFVVLSTDTEEGTRQGKYVQLLSENLFKVNAFSREEYAR